MENRPTVYQRPSSDASLRWGILRRSLLPRSSSRSDHGLQESTDNISRKAVSGFNLIYWRALDDHFPETLGYPLKGKDALKPRDICILYKLPVGNIPEISLIQRRGNCIELNDFEVSTRHDVDTTGLVCCWPSEDVLAYFCISHSDIFRSKKVLELGSGYGLAGFSIAACTDASEVVISDGNPEVVDYIQHNISINAGHFGERRVSAMMLHWSQEHPSEILNTFDVIVASDCTFCKEFHESLAWSVISLLKHSEESEAIFLSPKRGDSLEKFLQKIREIGLHYQLIENYDETVWNLHQKFLKGKNNSWPNYDKDHFYPLLVRIKFFPFS
uniref:Calmodulin-lysine N-methyltransferase n=1 Tax=Ananas comosus var. bracteatus TaxID=296719 RepID=A0A6V7PXM8_ANACO|nr:unnamed protein product [Ananas comosus var. bracteatus]